MNHLVSCPSSKHLLQFYIVPTKLSHALLKLCWVTQTFLCYTANNFANKNNHQYFCKFFMIFVQSNFLYLPLSCYCLFLIHLHFIDYGESITWINNHDDIVDYKLYLQMSWFCWSLISWVAPCNLGISKCPCWSASYR